MQILYGELEVTAMETNANKMPRAVIEYKEDRIVMCIIFEDTEGDETAEYEKHFRRKKTY